MDNRRSGDKSTNEYESLLKVDKIDYQLLQILLEDARAPYSSLAKVVGLSRVRVKERIDRLQKAGVIEKFTILVPASYMGKPLPVFFDISVAPESVEAAAYRISESDDIFVVYQMSGKSALHVHGFFADMPAVTSFVNDFLVTVPGIVSVQTEFLLRRYKLQRSLMVAD